MSWGAFTAYMPERTVDENLDAPGSSFVPLAFAESTHLPQPGVKPGASAPNRFYMYGVIARLGQCWQRATSWKPPTLTPSTTTETRPTRNLGLRVRHEVAALQHLIAISFFPK
jgi:hypothetical protein